MKKTKSQSSRQPMKGIDFFMVPCEPASEKERDAPRPVYLGPDTGNPVPNRYACPRCGECYVTYSSCAKHMGLISNIMGNCKGR